MTEQIFRLLYPPNLANIPIINQFVLKYNELTVNILRAEIIEGWAELQLIGNPGLIENAINWLRKQGIEVQTLGA